MLAAGLPPKAKGQTQMMHDLLTPARSPRPRCEHRIAKSLGDYAAATHRAVTAEPAHNNSEIDAPADDRQIPRSSLVSALDTM
jgi:hypothetical protein